MNCMSIELPTLPPTQPGSSPSWVVHWDGEGNQLLLIASWGNTEAVVLRRDTPRPPTDEAELQRWAGEALLALVELWRSG